MKDDSKSKLKRGGMYMLRGFVNLMTRILGVVLEAFGDIIVAILRSLLGLVTSFFSSSIGIGISLILIGYILFLYQDQEIGASMALIGIFTTLIPRRKKGKKR